MKRSILSAFALSCALSTAAFAEVTGKVTFDGPAPARKPVAGLGTDPNCGKLHKAPVLDEAVVVGKGGELANVVVSLKGDLKGAAPADEVVLDQQGCMYVPHVVSVTVGQKLVAANSDPFLHNVHSLPENNPPKNVAQPVKGQKDVIPTKAAETFKVKCDVHPWMAAWVAVFDHPFHSVTGEDGVFSIDTKGLKDGEYEVALWHEKFKDCGSGKVTVKDGKGTFDFKVKPKTAAAATATDGTVLVSAEPTVKGPSCCTDGSKCGLKAGETVKADDAAKPAEAAKVVALK
ncbi:MAG: hypothetical protein JWO31_824 [Phycisphaerales bacterium]|nr:hypothetical protein [Phycisphaerales bacterium]